MGTAKRGSQAEEEKSLAFKKEKNAKNVQKLL